MKVCLSWIILATISEYDRFYKRNIIFNSQPNVGFSNSLGIRPENAYFPFKLEPTTVFYNFLRNFFKSKGIIITQKKKPFLFEIASQEVKVNFNIKIYPPNILSIKVDTDSFSINNVTDLFELQKLSNHRNIELLVKAIISLVKSFNHKTDVDLSHNYKYKPIIRVSEYTGFPNYKYSIRKNRRIIIGLLIRSINYKELDKDIVDSIFNKNLEINKKRSNSTLLVDKQGVLLITSDNNFSSLDYTQLSILYELGFVLSEFSSHKTQYNTYSQELYLFLLNNIFKLVYNHEAMLRASISNIHAWELISNEFKLKDVYRSILDSFQDKINEKKLLFDELGLVWYKDSYPIDYVSRKVKKHENFDLSFIHSSKLKGIIETDFREAERSFTARNFKATMVLCGSIVEAILRDVYLHDDFMTANHANIQNAIKYGNKDLAFMISKLEDYNLLPGHNNPLKSLLNGVREYRNLIHPEAETRLKIQPTEKTAELSLNIVKLLIVNFAKRESD